MIWAAPRMWVTGRDEGGAMGTVQCNRTKRVITQDNLKIHWQVYQKGTYSKMGEAFL